MYIYPAAGTGLDASLPPWTADGGYPALFKRLRNPDAREKIAAEVRTPSDEWENFYLAAGSPGPIILLVGFKSEKLKPLTGKIARRSREDARQRSGGNDHGFDPGRRIADRLPSTS